MDAFQWDDENRQHIAQHDVTPSEVEEVICGPVLELEIQLHDGEERYPVVGETRRGRVLFVLYTIRRGLMRPVTAYSPAAYLKRLYFDNDTAEGK